MSTLTAYEIKDGAYGMYLAENGFAVDVDVGSLLYPKEQVDKEIEKITKDAISMFRDPNTCIGFDLKTSLGQIANAAFKHWNFVMSVQIKNAQLQLDNKQLLCINRDQANAANRLRDDMEQAIQHQKYKRCLAMAEWCDAEADVADADGDYEDMRWYQKWHNRWLAIAEKFKPNSTAQ